jgi:hypothetical protein
VRAGRHDIVRAFVDCRTGTAGQAEYRPVVNLIRMMSEEAGLVAGLMRLLARLG